MKPLDNEIIALTGSIRGHNNRVYRYPENQKRAASELESRYQKVLKFRVCDISQGVYESLRSEAKKAFISA